MRIYPKQNQTQQPQWQWQWQRRNNNDVENPARTTNLSGATNQAEEQQQQQSSRRGGRSLIKSIIVTLISLAWLGVFVMAVLDKDNDWSDSDTDGIYWIVFEYLNAVVPAAFLIYYWTDFQGRIFGVLSMVVNIWAIVYLVIIWRGNNEGGGNNIQRWVYTSMASTLYHSLMARCFINRWE